MGILETNLKLTYDKDTSRYFVILKKEEMMIPLLFDTGACRTSIGAAAFQTKYYSPESAEQIEECLLKRLDILDKNSNYCKTFISATGSKIYGFLVDMGQVQIGNLQLDHFYYYFLPKSNNIYGLLGDDFLVNCEYKHEINGNILISRFDVTQYYESHRDAISSENLNCLIEEITSEIPKIEEYNEYSEY